MTEDFKFIYLVYTLLTDYRKLKIINKNSADDTPLFFNCSQYLEDVEKGAERKNLAGKIVAFNVEF